MPAPTRRLQPPLPNARVLSYPRCMDAIPKRPLKTGFDVPDEKQLVAGLRAGDRASYEHLVRTFGGCLLAVGRRLVRNEEDARDCVQEAFLQAFRNIDKFEERASLGSWLHRIVVNAALMKLRARAPSGRVNRGFTTTVRRGRAAHGARGRVCPIGRDPARERRDPRGGASFDRSTARRIS